MADDVQAAAGGAGPVFATDDDGVRHWPYTKIAWGANDVYTKVSTGTASIPTQGADAENANVTSNPVLVGGRYDATPRTLGDTDAGAIALDADGAVHVADGGNSLTIDGTVTAELSATDNAVLDTIDSVLDNINAKLVTGTVIGDVNLGATDNAVLDSIDAAVNGTLTVGSHAVTNAGTFAVQASQATASNLNAQAVGNVASAATDSGNPVKVGGVFNTTQPTVTNGQRVNLQATARGALIVGTGVTNLGANVAQMNGTTVTMGNGASGTGVQRVTIASDSTGQVKLAAGTAAIGKLAANSGVDIGDVDVLSIAAGSNLIGNVGISGARTSGGTTIFRSIDLDEGACEVVKGSAGQIYWIHCINLGSSVRYVKIYNATSGTIGTGTPALTFPIPTQGDSNGAGFTLAIPNGIAFSTGICCGASTGVLDADTGAPGTNEVIINIGFA